MNKQYSKEEFERRLDLVCRDFALRGWFAESVWASASQNAEDCLVDCEGYSREGAFNDQSDLFIYYFRASMEGFAEEAES